MLIDASKSTTGRSEYTCSTLTRLALYYSSAAAYLLIIFGWLLHPQPRSRAAAQPRTYTVREYLCMHFASRAKDLSRKRALACPTVIAPSLPLASAPSAHSAPSNKNQKQMCVRRQRQHALLADFHIACRGINLPHDRSVEFGIATTS